MQLKKGADISCLPSFCIYESMKEILQKFLNCRCQSFLILSKQSAESCQIDPRKKTV